MNFNLNPWHIKLFLAFSSFYLLRKYLNGPKNPKLRSFDKKIVIITGASAGIGKETARDLLRNQAIVVFACRNKEKTLSVIKSISDQENVNNAYFIPLDLTSFESVKNFEKEFSKKFDRLDLLINNAGQFTDKLEFTEDGVEKTFQTNHLSHFLLTGLMLKYLKKSEDPRIINVSSRAHMRVNDSLNYEKPYTKESYSSFKVYGITKAANILFTENLKEFFEKKSEFNKIKTASLHPGVVRTEFTRLEGRGFLTKFFTVLFYPLLYLIAKDEKMGAQTQLYLAHVENEEFKSGEYYSDCALTKKNEIIRKFNLELNVNKITCEALKKSKSYQDFIDDIDFKDYFEYFSSKCC